MYRKASIDKDRVRTYDAAHLAKKDAILAKLEGFLPSDSLAINTEIVRLRVALNDTSVIQFALDLMNRVHRIYGAEEAHARIISDATRGAIGTPSSK